MRRYCVNCREEYEFDPRAITGEGNLICPDCGGIIPKDSRRPSTVNNDAMEAGIGNAVSEVFHIAYIFYVTLAVIGIISYFAKWDTVLYVVSGIAIASYLIQLITGTTAFTWGVILLPLGAALGYFALHGGIRGVCLGILAVFLIRHVIRDLLWTLVGKIIGLGNR